MSISGTYRVLSAISPEALDELVTLAIRQGWKLQGGVAVVRWIDKNPVYDDETQWEILRYAEEVCYEFYQAMIWQEG